MIHGAVSKAHWFSGAMKETWSQCVSLSPTQHDEWITVKCVKSKTGKDVVRLNKRRWKQILGCCLCICLLWNKTCWTNSAAVCFFGYLILFGFLCKLTSSRLPFVLFLQYYRVNTPLWKKSGAFVWSGWTHSNHPQTYFSVSWTQELTAASSQPQTDMYLSFSVNHGKTQKENCPLISSSPIQYSG